MKFLRFFFVTVLSIASMLAVAGDETASEDGGERGIKVAVSTLNTSDSAVMATRPQDGEKPVQPLNIHIGPSKLTLFGYAQTQFEVTKTGTESKNSFNLTRFIFMANAELTR